MRKRDATQINHLKLRGRRGSDDLNRFSVDKCKRATPGWMSPDDFSETALQSAHVQSPMATDRDGFVVNGDVWDQLGMQPDLLLPRGERYRLITRRARNTTGGRRFISLQVCGHVLLCNVPHIASHIRQTRLAGHFYMPSSDPWRKYSG